MKIILKKFSLPQAIKLCFLCCLELFHSQALIAENNLANPPKLQVAFAPISPWAVPVGEGRYSGILVEYFQALAEKISFELAIQDIPLARVNQYIQAGKLDISVAHQDISMECCENLGSVYTLDVVVYSRKTAEKFVQNKPSELELCRSRLSQYQVPGFKTLDLENIDNCLKMLVKERVSYVIGEALSTHDAILSLPKESQDMIAAPVVVGQKTMQLFVQKRLPASDREKLRRAIKDISFKSFVTQYFSKRGNKK